MYESHVAARPTFQLLNDLNMKLVAVGDVVLAGKVESAFSSVGADIIDPGLSRSLQSADIVIANIECPLTDQSAPQWDHFATMRGGTAGADLLGSLGVTVGALANNHIADYGVQGLQDTIGALESRGIRWLGAGLNLQEARKPLIFKCNGATVGLIAAAQPEISAAAKHRWGASVLSEQWLLQETASLAEQVDVLVVILHFGIEFADHPAPGQVRLCRSLIDRGAAMVIGHHPHVPQAFEWYQEGFIAYSLGNFIFDMAPGPHAFSRVGLILNAEFKGSRLVKVAMTPVDTSSGFPVPLNRADREKTDAYLDGLNLTLSDPERLAEQYYFASRENLAAHIKALFAYGLKRFNLKRIGTWLHAQTWPQIVALRLDLLRFIFSGEAYAFERRKPRTVVRTETRLLLWVCRIAGRLGRLMDKR